MAEEKKNWISSLEESGAEKALTPIHRRIHSSATADHLDGDDELDRIAIDNFLDILAEIALAIARRREH